MMNHSVFEMAASGFVWLTLIIYHIHFVVKTKRHPMTTAIGITSHVRLKWAEHVMREGHDILAVQTLRNQVMAATFLASTAILISLGVIGLAFRPGIFAEVSHALNLTGVISETVWLIK